METSKEGSRATKEDRINKPKLDSPLEASEEHDELPGASDGLVQPAEQRDFGVLP